MFKTFKFVKMIKFISALATVLASKCLACGSEYRVKMHNIRMLKDISNKKGDFISKANRK